MLDNEYIKPEYLQIEMFPLDQDIKNEMEIQTLKKKYDTLRKAYGAHKNSSNYRISVLEAQLSYLIGKICKPCTDMSEKRMKVAEMIA